tara:strand:- start:53 stop:619 length:567 start_codon:yes stop_codon:yes gene_type:complete
MKHTYIYYLHNGDNVPFYIGKSNTPHLRKTAHKSKHGLDTLLEVLDEVPDDEWKFWETYYIGQFKVWGFALLNKNKGGGGAHHPIFPADRGAKISKATLGKTKSHKGRSFVSEHKDKIKATRGFLKEREVTWLSKSVLQLDLDGNFIKEFVSLKEAQYIMGKPDSNGISSCCNNTQHTAYGFKWKFNK